MDPKKAAFLVSCPPLEVLGTHEIRYSIQVFPGSSGNCNDFLLRPTVGAMCVLQRNQLKSATRFGYAPKNRMCREGS